MSYDREHSLRLIRETDNAGTLVTHAERAMRNQLQAADDEVTRLRRMVTDQAIPTPPAIESVPEIVTFMLANEGVYVCGDRRSRDASVVIVSRGARLIALSMDQVLEPQGFLPTFIVRAGPFK